MEQTHVLKLACEPIPTVRIGFVGLGKRGMVNNFLVWSGLFAKPQDLLYNEFSMTVGFVQLFLPQMILALIGVMDNIPDDLTLAAGNLGAGKLESFFRVIFPLSISGLVG